MYTSQSNLKTKPVNIRLTPKQLERVDKVAKECETHRSKVIRMALTYGLDQCKGKKWYEFD